MNNNDTSNFFGGNQHNDILLPNPESEEQKARLVEELKRRGNAAFQSGSMVEADVLYSRAIEHNDTIAPLFGNRSMTRAKMGKFEEALEDAIQATKKDSKWAKGFYRKAQAEIGLKRFDDAKESLETVLGIDPKNKAAKMELDKIGKRKSDWEASESRRKERLAKEAAEKAEEDAKSRIISKKIVQVDKNSTQTNDKKPTTTATTKANDDEVDLSMRGYRTLADGRKTTYFNRELTEEEKNMLKDNKPKPLDAPIQDDVKVLEKGVSAWNAGGTFEEKDVTEWAEKELKDLIVGIKGSVPLVDTDGDIISEDLVVTGLANMEGDASITFTRGKKRHIFDFNFEVKWKIDCNGKKIEGSILLPEVNGDDIQDDPSEIIASELRWSNRDKAGQNQVHILKFLKDSSESGFLGKINAAVYKFAKAFRAMT